MNRQSITLTRAERRLIFVVGLALVCTALLGVVALLGREGEQAARPACRVAGRYVALGSSSTEGAGASDPAQTSYVALIAADLRAHCPGAALFNLGVGGADVTRILAQVSEIERLRPSVVTIFPIYDYWSTDADTFQRGYAELLDRIGATGATVFFGDLRLAREHVCGHGGGPGGCFIASDAVKIRLKNDAVATLARERPWVIVVPVLDQRMSHPEWQVGDGLHVNDRGHAGFAAPFQRALARWLDKAVQESTQALKLVQ